MAVRMNDQNAALKKVILGAGSVLEEEADTLRQWHIVTSLSEYQKVNL